MTDSSFPSSFEGIQQLVATLRSPGGCPWDREQSADSLKHLFLEECYELVEAIEEGDVEKIAEELGDVLFHGASQIQIAEERGDFSGSDVFQAGHREAGPPSSARLRRRCYGGRRRGRAALGPDQANEEMAGTDRSILDGVPKAMPAMGYAQAVQGRAARMGFDWDDYAGVLEKVAEELRELEEVEMLTTPAKRSWATCSFLRGQREPLDGYRSRDRTSEVQSQVLLQVHDDGAPGTRPRPRLRVAVSRRERRALAGSQEGGRRTVRLNLSFDSGFHPHPSRCIERTNDSPQLSERPDPPDCQREQHQHRSGGDLRGVRRAKSLRQESGG